MTINSDQLVKAIVSSEGDLFLAAERLNKSSGQHITEYQLIDNILSDSNAAKMTAEQLRNLLTIKVFYVINQLQQELLGNLSEIPPKDLARTLASFITAFSTMTAPAAKVTFDFDAEVARAAEELNMDPEQIKLELKDILSRNK